MSNVANLMNITTNEYYYEFKIPDGCCPVSC